MNSDSSLPGKQTPGSKPLYIREKSAETTTEATRQQCSGSSSGIPFNMIPQDDLDWVADQKPSVFRLFADCWRSDPYGTRWMQLTTKLKSSAFTYAKKRLTIQGLFVFKRETSIQDSRSTVCWMVKNLHGSRVASYWGDTANVASNAANVAIEAANVDTTAVDKNNTAANVASISPQTLTQSDVQERSGSFQYYFKIFSLSLSIAERENFENFIREEWKKKTTKPGQPGEEIISLERFLAKEEDCKNWYALFLNSPAGKQAKKEAIAAQYDWENDPRFEEWLNRAFYDGYAWAQENEAEREQRIAFLEWAQATDPYQGRLY